MTAAASSGLDPSSGIAQFPARHWIQASARVSTGPIAPGCDRYLKPLGKTLRFDFVAQPPHDIAVWANEYDSQLMAQVSECGVLGHKAPTHPYCVRTCRREHLLRDGQ